MAAKKSGNGTMVHVSVMAVFMDGAGPQWQDYGADGVEGQFAGEGNSATSDI